MSYSIFIHTHTDCADALEICLGQLKTYLPDNKIYISINEEHDLVKDHVVFLYDENTPYTKRVVDALSQIEEDIILYLHEDMFLYDTPQYEKIEKCINEMKNSDIDMIKLIKTNCSDYGFSVQPSLWKRESFLRLLDGVFLNIWELEVQIQDKFNREFNGFEYSDGSETLRGLGHFDSTIFPYTATAIISGMWNDWEYESEINMLIEKYNIKSSRKMRSSAGERGK